jgi:HPt (histidine-containing phosphotransfer) domain-containing protein
MMVRPRAKVLTRAQRQALEALARAYEEELSEKFAAMQDSAAALVRDGWDRPLVEALYHQAHRVVGSAGVYGLPALARAAAVLEALLKELLQDPVWPPRRPPAEVATIVKAVKQAARPTRGRR